MKRVLLCCRTAIAAIVYAGVTAMVTVLMAGCATSPGMAHGSAASGRTAAMNTLTPVQRTAGWRLLFDGKTTNGWRGFKKSEAPAGWQAVDGELRRVAAGGDLMTRDMYQNFDLSLEWKISPGGNSGVMYHVIEQGEETYETGPEMQILDDVRHPDGKSRLTAAGSDFGLYPAAEGAVKPAGEWNVARLIVNGAHVEHWLNGVKVTEYDLWSPDWKQRVASSKFRHWPQYGLAKSGYIALQDHEFPVAFRNIMIRVLP